MLLINKLDLKLIESALDFVDTAYKKEKKLIVKQMLNKLNSFCIQAMTKI